MYTDNSIDINKDYLVGAKEIAISIFNEYFNRDAENYIQLDNKTRHAIYFKFGCKLHSMASPDDV